MSNTALVDAEECAAKALPKLSKAKGSTVIEPVLLEAYEAAGLSRLKVASECGARIDAAAREGLLRVTLPQAAELLYRRMKSVDHRLSVTVERSHALSWDYDAQKGDWVDGPHVSTDAWLCAAHGVESLVLRCGAVGDLQLVIPRGVALRVAEARESGLFDQVAVVAPVDAFTTAGVADPVVLGVIHRRAPTDIYQFDEMTGLVKSKKTETRPESQARAYFVLAVWH